MNDRGAGEIEKAERGQPAGLPADQRSAPGPVAEDGIDERRDDDGEDDIALEGHPLGHGARRDRGAGAHEGGLKDEEEDGLGRHRAHAPSDEAADGSAEHHREADDVEDEDGDDQVGEIFLRDVDAVLGAHRAGLDEEEADLHHEDERRGPQDPSGVERGLHIRRRLDQTAQFGRARFEVHICPPVGHSPTGNMAANRKKRLNDIIDS
ncbi:MAG: hypothetical protein AAF321_02570 [Pseudomonadota bacterium]